jgi:tryptophan 7-halogenase
MSNSEMFPAASYQYVLFGMGFKMDTSLAAAERDQGSAQRAFAQNEALKVKWTRVLPRNRDLIDKIKEHGLQRI